MAVARAALAVFAVIACAWFALGIRQAHDTNQAQAIVSGQQSLTAGQAAHVDSLLKAAGTLNPDLQIDLLRGEAALLRHDRPRAMRSFESIVHREPDNLQGWVLLAQAAYGNGPLINRSLGNIDRLDPRGVR
jgi:predicted Zn-dependent protease